MFGYTPPRRHLRSHSKQEIEPETGYPTTGKHLYGSPPAFRRSNPRLQPRPFPEDHPSLEQEIIQLQRRKQRYIYSRQYSRAEKVDKKIKRAQSVIVRERLNQVLEQQKDRKRALSQQHKREMEYLRGSWGLYFARLSQRQSEIMKLFKKDNEKQALKAQARIQRKCRSLHSSSREIRDLKQQEKLLQKTQNFAYLKHVKKQLVEQVWKQRQKRSLIVQRYAEVEEQRLSVTQSKKYTVLVERLEEYRRIKERNYLREQKRQKQRYRNMLQHLKHRQVMQLQDPSLFMISIDN